MSKLRLTLACWMERPRPLLRELADAVAAGAFVEGFRDV